MISYPFLHMPEAYIIARTCDIISKIYHPFRQERISLKNPVCRWQTGFFMEQGTGVEPASEAWEATIIADIRTLRDGKHYSTAERKMQAELFDGVRGPFTRNTAGTAVPAVAGYFPMAMWGNRSAMVCSRAWAAAFSSSPMWRVSSLPSSSRSTSRWIT